MRAAAFRLARADLLGRPGQTALTAFAIFAAATALVVTLALRAGLDEPFADAMEQTNGAHVSVYGELTDADVETLANLPGVAAAESKPRANVRAPLAGGVRRRRAGGIADGDRPSARHRGPGARIRLRGAGRAQLRPRRGSAGRRHPDAGRHRIRDRRPGRDDPAGDLSALAPGPRVGAGGHLEPALGGRPAHGPRGHRAVRRGRAAGAPRRPRWSSPTGTTCATRSPTRAAPTR